MSSYGDTDAYEKAVDDALSYENTLLAEEIEQPPGYRQRERRLYTPPMPPSLYGRKVCGKFKDPAKGKQIQFFYGRFLSFLVLEDEPGALVEVEDRDFKNGFTLVIWAPIRTLAFCKED